ncbi:Tom22-domain-containing protein [Leucogyrophana mollusca]|uniref:Tom22-domain-containing protein n=1 Tax=Leucogyrophana mollusca TaxID=85980 RepID=A0ACB8B7Y1_9AGAM|nr:Tom22-domain-containing protein [Leucogyrophana mollusca]
MVKVEIVEEKDHQDANNSPYASASSSRTSSSVSLSSVSSELSADETLYDRISALVDIVPPTTRHRISTRVSKAASFVKQSGKVVGNIVWIVTTSALLVGLPLALSLEDEAKIVAQEREMMAQQQGAQQVSFPVYVSLCCGLVTDGVAAVFFCVADAFARICIPTASRVKSVSSEGSCTTWVLSVLFKPFRPSVSTL